MKNDDCRSKKTVGERVYVEHLKGKQRMNQKGKYIERMLLEGDSGGTWGT